MISRTADAEASINRLLANGPFHITVRFQTRQNERPEPVHLRFPALAEFPDSSAARDARPMANCFLDSAEHVTVELIQKGEDNLDFGLQIARALASRVYRFKEGRVSRGECQIGLSSDLDNDAANLAEVLGNLQGRNPTLFRALNEDLRYILPQIHECSIRPNEGHAQHHEIVIFETESNDAADAIRLADSGTGVAQVLAILYVAVAYQDSRVILIDEPQTFLHPGALRKLLEVLRGYDRHQYVIATHSPTAIMASPPATLTLVRKKPREAAVLETVDIGETQALRRLLEEVGARLSDVFGADQVLWVEGETERVCFERIMTSLCSRSGGVAVVPVLSTDDALGSHANRLIKIYERLAAGRGLLPPTVGFIFDRECRSAAEQREISRRLGPRVEFLHKRMYENYLLDAKALESVVNGIDDYSPDRVTAAASTVG